MINHKKATTYYPRKIGQVESTNKVLEAILRKIINSKHIDWDVKLPTVLWAYQNSYKTSTKHTPFELIYDLQPFLPLEFLIPYYCMGYNLNYSRLVALMAQMEDLCFLDKWRKNASHNNRQFKARGRYGITMGRPIASQKGSM
jgi:hypothetical protein